MEAVVVPSVIVGTEPKYRFENKYRVSLTDCARITAALCFAMPYDRHTDETGHYTVRTMYLDNLYNTALLEKLDGVERRSKYRIRLYNGSTSYIKLEKKQRVHNMSQKTSCRITAEQCEKLLAGDTGFLLELDSPVAAEFYYKIRCGYRPKCVMEYWRQAFAFEPGNIRITFDKYISAGYDCAEFLEPKITCTTVPMEAMAVLEIKYDNYLPEHISRILQIGKLSKNSVSKYVYGRAYRPY